MGSQNSSLSEATVINFVTNMVMINYAFLVSCISAATSFEFPPRKLTPDELKYNGSPPIKSIFTPVKTKNTNLTEIQFKAVPKGTNKEKNWQDAIRMPGTNWCGKGWRADNARSMGGYAGADRCCRQHDLGCSISIEPGVTQYGLTNPRIHTVMRCSCDERFRSCLKMARTQAADIVGNLFFNIADIPCFVFSKEVVCTNRNWWGRCISEEEKMTAVWRKPMPYYT